MSAPKSCGAEEGKNSKGKGKNGKMVQSGGHSVQKCSIHLGIDVGSLQEDPWKKETTPDGAVNLSEAG